MSERRRRAGRMRFVTLPCLFMHHFNSFTLCCAFVCSQHPVSVDVLPLCERTLHTAVVALRGPGRLPRRKRRRELRAPELHRIAVPMRRRHLQDVRIFCLHENHASCMYMWLRVIAEWLFCDGRPECDDGSDEWLCLNRSNWCQKPGDCVHCNVSSVTSSAWSYARPLLVPKQWLCDGDIDCPNGTDEHNCHHKGWSPHPLNLIIIFSICYLIYPSLRSSVRRRLVLLQQQQVHSDVLVLRRPS